MADAALVHSLASNLRPFDKHWQRASSKVLCEALKLRVKMLLPLSIRRACFS
jgi:hypothetical protein